MLPMIYAALQRDTLSEDSPFAVRTKRDANGLPRLEMRIYNGTGGALTANACYQLNFDGDEESNPRLAAVASGTVNTQYLVVATEAAANAAWTWGVVWGYYEILVDGNTDVAKDDYLKCTEATPGPTALIKDGTSRSANTVAIATAAQQTNSPVSTLCFILGERMTVGL